MTNLYKKLMTAVAVIAVLTTLGLSAPANAQHDNNDRRGVPNEMNGRGMPHGMNDRDWHEHERKAQRWHTAHREPVPHVIYAPPTVVYSPPPPLGISLFLPLDIR